MEQKTTLRVKRDRTPGRYADAGIAGPGRLQPQAVPLEEAVLGALMLDREALPTILDILTPDAFYTDGHQCIYKAVLDLFEKSKPIDLLTVTEELRKRGELDRAGGAFYLVELTNKVTSSANIEYHARIIAQKHIQRELIRVSNQIIRDAFEDTTDVFDLLDSAEQNLFGIAEKNLGRSTERISTLMAKVMKQMEEASTRKDGLTGIPTGFVELDRLTSGFQPSDLIIVAARPGMGKTSFTLALARNAAVDFGKPVAIFSLEMSNVQLVQRLISLEAEIELKRLRDGQMHEYEWQQLHKAMERLGDVPIFIDDTPGINVFELRAKCRRLKMQHDIQMVIVDYLQLMTSGQDGSKGNREQEISTISRALKNLAKDLGVPVIALSQLSRAVEVRGGTKRPQLSDLRESGAIEQDADIVSFIYRPEYYNILADDEGNSNEGLAELIVAKHRNGATDTVNLKFVSSFAKFTNFDEHFTAGSSSPPKKGGDFTTDHDDMWTMGSSLNAEDDPF